MSRLIIITENGFGPDAWAELRRYWLGQDGVPERDDVIELAGDDDPLSILKWIGQINAINITFGGTQDGRGFSLARRFRDEGFDGRLRATGPLMVDQYRHARQSGFDEIAITQDHAKRMPEQHWLDAIDLPLPDYQSRLMGR